MPIQPEDKRFTAHPRFDLAGAKAHQPALQRVMAEWEAAGGLRGPDVVLTAQMQAGGGIVFLWPDGTPVGKISAAHRIARAVADGAGIARVEVANLTADDAKDGLIILRAEAWTGPPGTVYEPPPPQEYVYMAGLVGEQHHAAAVSRCLVGEQVTLMHEQGNPHDGKALAAFSSRGERLGYIARDHWLRRAIMEDGDGCTAVIASMNPGYRGFREVVLQVRLGGPPVKAVQWSGETSTLAADNDQQAAGILGFIAIAFIVVLVLAAIVGAHK